MLRRLRVASIVCALAAACGDAKAPPPAAAGQATVVHAVRAEKADVFEWVFGQGSAVAVRRKALYFQIEGKVSYVARGPDGAELRPGDAVAGPKQEELLGQLLAKVDDRDVLANVEANRAELQRTQTQRVAAEAQLKSAEAELEAAQRDLETARRLLATGAGSQDMVDNGETRVKTARARVDSAASSLGSAKSGTTAQAAQVKRSEVAQERTAIFAPFDGVVAALNIKEGDYYFGAQISRNPGEQLRSAPIVVIDPTEFEIEIELPEYEASKVQVGMIAGVLTGEDIAAMSQADDPRARPELLVTRGTVFAVSPAIDPSARSVLVTVRVHERADRLRDGEFASCFIMTRQAQDVVAIPYAAFVRAEDKAFAFVVPEGSQQAERRIIDVGIAGVSHIEVRAGIQPGELVVTRGRRSLGDGSRVDVAKVAEPAMLGTPRPPQPEGPG